MRRSSAGSMARAREVVEGLAIMNLLYLRTGTSSTLLLRLFGFLLRKSKVGGGIRRLSFDSPVAPPLPVQDLGHVLAVFVDVLRMLDQLVADHLLGIGGSDTKLGHAVDHVRHQVETIHIV